ncbi:MAG: C_GCAxxG_C_C family protein [Treponema sp.]|nr:C_GCAxxG_C_C family protein [Candidatus Treponema scatequi]
MTVEEARSKAMEYFTSGYNCSQSVFAVFAEMAGVDKSLALKIAQGLGGGMGRQRELCGAVSGMIMAVSSMIGTDDPKDKETKDNLYKVTQKLCQKFREKNGSIVCRELLGFVPMGQSEEALKNKTPIEHYIEKPESEARTSEYLKKRPCNELCADACEILCEWINDN